MSQPVKLVVVIPLGPSANPQYVMDTIQSVLHYTGPSTKVLVIDDSGTCTGEELQIQCPGLKVLNTPGSSGYGRIGVDGQHGPNEGGLYYWLSVAYSFAYENYDFDVILKLDEDALIIGHRPEEDAIAFFTKHPNVGLIGSHRLDCNGKLRGFSGPAKKILDEVSLRRLLRNPGLWIVFRKLLSRALRRGYEAGEYVQGGACFFNSECIRRLKGENLLPKKQLRKALCDEDYLFPLLVRSVSMSLGDFATGNLPMGIRWRGLPCSPEELVLRKKKVIHSVRFWEDMKEDEIRRFFRSRRLEGA